MIVQQDSSDATAIGIVMEPFNANNQEERIRAALGLARGPLPEVQSKWLHRYYEYLTANLSLPFDAEYAEDISGYRQLVSPVTVVALLHPDEHGRHEEFGLLCRARRGDARDRSAAGRRGTDGRTLRTANSSKTIGTGSGTGGSILRFSLATTAEGPGRDRRSGRRRLRCRRTAAPGRRRCRWRPAARRGSRRGSSGRDARSGFPRRPGFRPSVKSRQRSRNRRDRSRPPSSTADTMPPKASICRRARACCGWLARPG